MSTRRTSSVSGFAIAHHRTTYSLALILACAAVTGLNSTPICGVPRGPSELLLVVRERVQCQDTSVTLGEAWVVRRAGGVLATVYVNCVAWLATAARTDVAVLLGRVVAHELGHLMMRSSAHARRGLMRPNWTPDEVRRNRAADWAFTAADVAAMRQPGTVDEAGEIHLAPVYETAERR